MHANFVLLFDIQVVECVSLERATRWRQAEVSLSQGMVTCGYRAAFRCDEDDRIDSSNSYTTLGFLKVLNCIENDRSLEGSSKTHV